MKLVVKHGSDCASTECSLEVGAAFTLSVEIVEGPSEGYVGAQSFINFGSAMTYTMTDTAIEEVVWPDCDVFASRSQLAPDDVSHGCLTGLPPDSPISTYTGTFAELAFTCAQNPSSTLVRLLPLGDPFAGTSGTKFVSESGASIPAKVSDMTIHCMTAQTATPAPTDVPTSTPSTTPPSPTPAVQVGDANCDGRVNALDAALMLQLSAGLTSVLPCPSGGDANGDGLTNPLDATLVLQFAAGLLATLPP